jgi:hypothetical protein
MSLTFVLAVFLVWYILTLANQGSKPSVRGRKRPNGPRQQLPPLRRSRYESGLW